jgi:hypothetical protein
MGIIIQIELRISERSRRALIMIQIMVYKYNYTLMAMHDAHPSELAGAAQLRVRLRVLRVREAGREKKQNVRHVAWVEHCFIFTSIYSIPSLVRAAVFGMKNFLRENRVLPTTVTEGPRSGESHNKSLILTYR